MIVFCLLIVSTFALVTPDVVVPTNFRTLRKSGASTLYKAELPASEHGYVHDPYLIDLHGTRHQIGYDYAALLNTETVLMYTTFMQSMFPTTEDQFLIDTFIDYCWDS
jgi:hypothetical protein